MTALRFVATFIAAAAAGSAAFADPPGRVGRLSYLEGTVSMHAQSDEQWTQAVPNYPVTTGYSYWTQPDARAEIQVGPLELHMDHATELDVIRLDDTTTQLQVDQGVINLHLATAPAAPIQIATPSGQVQISQPGNYHIDAGAPDANGPSPHMAVTVFQGQAEAIGQNATLQVQPGETATISANPVSVSVAEGGSTPLDDWALAREQAEAAAYAARQQYVPPAMTGAPDLYNYGQWAAAPQYGMVWYPTNVATDWAPYRYGHWRYIAPWGWTWVDDAPWGFAPFHYGRWAMINGRWGWCPGSAEVAPPVYAPALVAFIGGGGFSIAISAVETPSVGWVPLAPFEVYHPYYQVSPAYLRAVNLRYVHPNVINNITNVTQVNVVNNYANYRAATVVPTTAFREGREANKVSVHVPENVLIAKAKPAPEIAHLAPVQHTPRPIAAGPQFSAHPPGTPITPAEQERRNSPMIPNLVHEGTIAHPETPTITHPEVPQVPQNRFEAQQHPQQEEEGFSTPRLSPGPPHRVSPAQAHQAAPEEPARVVVQPKPVVFNRPPVKEVPHPAQQTHFTPTTHGWVREQGKPAAPQPHPQPHPQAQQEKDERQHP